MFIYNIMLLLQRPYNIVCEIRPTIDVVLITYYTS